jgi:hypothetical protein
MELTVHDIKDFQDYVEEKVGQEIDIESSIDPVTKLEKDDKKIVFHPTSIIACSKHVCRYLHTSSFIILRFRDYPDFHQV